MPGSAGVRERPRASCASSIYRPCLGFVQPRAPGARPCIRPGDQDCASAGPRAATGAIVPQRGGRRRRVEGAAPVCSQHPTQPVASVPAELLAMANCSGQPAGDGRLSAQRRGAGRASESVDSPGCRAPDLDAAACELKGLADATPRRNRWPRRRASTFSPAWWAAGRLLQRSNADIRSRNRRPVSGCRRAGLTHCFERTLKAAGAVAVVNLPMSEAAAAAMRDRDKPDAVVTTYETFGAAGARLARRVCDHRSSSLFMDFSARWRCRLKGGPRSS